MESPTVFKQGATVKPLHPLGFKVNGKGRIIKIDMNDRLWVGNSRVDQASTQTVELCRPRQPMGCGYRLPIAQVRALFVECLD